MAAFETISKLVGVGSLCRRRLRETGELLLGVGEDRGIFLGLSISGEDFMRTTSIFYLNLRSASTSA